MQQAHAIAPVLDARVAGDQHDGLRVIGLQQGIGRRKIVLRQQRARARIADVATKSDESTWPTRPASLHRRVRSARSHRRCVRRLW